jgi:peptide subunit release factor 1 (eRF1)
MQVNELDRPTLRRLAELKPRGAKVLSLFLSLDPSEFATPPARASAVTSLCDEAERRVREEDRLGHDERVALLEDVQRARSFFARGDYARGARGLALYCCRPAGLFEAIKLPQPVDFGVVIDDSPFVEPLADLVSVPEVCVVLVNRRSTRLLCGSSEGLREIGSFQDDVHGQHDQGGWSQARYQRSIQEEVDDHLRRSADALFRYLRRRPADLLIGAPEELRRSFESRLHPQVRELVVGHVDVDVEHSSPEQVHRAATAVLESRRRDRERELVDRLQQGLGGSNRAAVGLEQVLSALYERRVEALLYQEGLRCEGRVCPQCGWMTASVERCPVDGIATDTRANVLENAVESAIAQSAQVVAVRHHAEDMRAFDGVAALLRF